MITEISDTHWIDGTFDGGHFISSNINADSTNLVPAYNTSVIQKFKFYDNNTAQADDFNYLSWMDINYFTSSVIHLNKDTTIFRNIVAFGLKTSFIQRSQKRLDRGGERRKVRGATTREIREGWPKLTV